MQVTDAWESGGEGLDIVARCNATWHGHAKHLTLGMRPAVSHIDEPLMAQPKLREALRPGAQRHETWRATRAARESTLAARRRFRHGRP